MAKHTEEELEAMGLTDEEREALLSEDEEQQETDEEEGDDDGTDGESADDDDDSDGDGDGEDPDGAEDQSSSDETEGAEGDDAEADGAGGDESKEGEAARQQPAPILAAEDPGDAEERLTEIAQAKEKLIEQFDDGELTAKEYQLELDKLAKQEREIEQAQFKAQIAREMEETRAKNEWLATVNAFLNTNTRYKESPILYQTLDMTVRNLAAQEENQNLSGAEILAKAHEMITAELGLQDAKRENGKKTGSKKIDAPPTLARVPAADMTELENTRWSKLDRLMETDPERYERELAKLPEADREAYLQTQ